MDKVAAKKFLSKGKIHYKDLVSRKTGRQYEATVEMVDPGEGNSFRQELLCCRLIHPFPLACKEFIILPQGKSTTVEMVDPGEGNVQFNLSFPQR